MKKLLPLFIYSLCFSEDINSLYKEASILENQGNYKEAMILYKKAASLNITKEDKYIIDLSKNEDHKVENFTTMKKSFYQKQINKVKDKETDESLQQLVTKDFNLYPYKKNYLLPATYNFNEIDDRKQLETAFQISIEKPITYNFFGLDESISAAYTQKSFWQTAKDSSPFRETNYEPEVFIQFPYKDSETFKAYKISLIHTSNGRNNEESRSWNRAYIEGYFQLSNLFLVPKIWYRIPEASGDDDNSDIEDYYGKGELTLLYAYKKHTFELMLRNNLEFNSGNKGAAELNWTFPLPNFLSTENSYGLLQVFSGYGNSLIDYDQEIHKIGLGIAFSR
ncbi:phospholipase A [bacterium]|jgi:phospholipase A1|nr:phospholipase A [bacterium]